MADTEGENRPTKEPAAPGGTIRIGDTTLPRMGYGAMRLSGDGVWGDPSDRDSAKAVLRRARELGVRLYDTASAYGPETNEALIAEALQPYEDVLIATKAGLERPAPGRWEPNGRPARLRDWAEGSLKRLGVDTIDLLQLHAPDPDVAYEESVGALGELRDEGKVRHIGISNVSVEQLRAAQSVTEIVSVQNRYNVGDRSSEDVLRACETQNIAFLPYFPIAGGELVRSGGPLQRVAERHNATVPQVCLAWLLQRSPVIAPIPGTSSVEHVEENIAAVNLTLTPEDVAELETV